MRLAQMTTDQLCDVLLAIAVPIDNIAKDDNVIKAIKRMGKGYDAKEPVFRRFANIYSELATLALKTHRKDVLAILASMTGKTREEIEAQNAIDTIKEIKALFDGELMDFFSLFETTEPGAS